MCVCVYAIRFPVCMYVCMYVYTCGLKILYYLCMNVCMCVSDNGQRFQSYPGAGVRFCGGGEPRIQALGRRLLLLPERRRSAGAFYIMYICMYVEINTFMYLCMLKKINLLCMYDFICMYCMFILYVCMYVCTVNHYNRLFQQGIATGGTNPLPSCFSKGN